MKKDTRFEKKPKTKSTSEIEKPTSETKTPQPLKKQNNKPTQIDKINKADPAQFDLINNSSRAEWIVSRSSQEPKVFSKEIKFGLEPETLELILKDNSPKKEESSYSLDSFGNIAFSKKTAQKVSVENQFESSLETLNQAILEASSGDLESSLESLRKNKNLASIVQKYEEESLSKEYKLCFLSYELNKIENDIFNSDSSSPEKNKRTLAQTESQGISFEEFRQKLNDIEFNQIKNFNSLQLAERKPATADFKSKLLSPEELKEVLGDGVTLSAQQFDILLLVEDLLSKKQSRSKIKGALDTGEGKTFLTEKIAAYQQVIAKRINEKPSDFKIINVDLANQNILKTANKEKSLSSNIYIIDEFKFFKDRNVRSLVDKGAKIVIFGASENYYKAIEDVEKLKLNDGNKVDSKQKNIGNSEEEISKKRSDLAKKLEELNNAKSLIKTAEESESKLKEANKQLEKKKKYLNALIGESKIYSARGNFSLAALDSTITKYKAFLGEENDDVLENLEKLKKKLNEVLRCAGTNQQNLSGEAGRGQLVQLNLLTNNQNENQITKAYNEASDIFNKSLKKSITAKELELEKQIKDNQKNKPKAPNPNDIKEQIQKLRTEIFSLKELAKNSSSISETKFVSKKRDLENFEDRRRITKDKIADQDHAKIKVLDQSSSEVDWHEKLISQHKENSAKKTQDIFPGISLKYGKDEEKRDLEEKLKTVLKETKKDLIVVNLVTPNQNSEGEHWSLVAKKLKDGSFEFIKTRPGYLSWYKAISDDAKIKKIDSSNILNGEDRKLSKIELARIEEEIGHIEFEGAKTQVEEQNRFAKSYKIPVKENIIMLYAGENFEGVVGGDNAELSLLNIEDKQNIYFQDNKHVNLDLIKQIFGRNRNDAVNGKDIEKNFIFDSKLELDQDFNNDSFAKLAEENSAKQDLEEMIAHYKNKINNKYCKEGGFKTLEKLLKDDENFVRKIILGDLEEFEVLKSESLLKDGIEDKKFVRDLRLMAFYEVVRDNKLNDFKFYDSLQKRQSEFNLTKENLEKIQTLENGNALTQEDVASLISLLPYVTKTELGKEIESEAVKKRKSEIEINKKRELEAKKSAFSGEVEKRATEIANDIKTNLVSATVELGEKNKKLQEKEDLDTKKQEKEKKAQKQEEEKALRLKEEQEKKEAIEKRAEEKIASTFLELEKVKKQISELKNLLKTEKSENDHLELNKLLELEENLQKSMEDQKNKAGSNEGNKKLQEQARRNHSKALEKLGKKVNVKEDLKKNEELRSEKELLEQKQLKNERETIFSFAQTEKDNTEKNDASQPQIIIEESEEIEATLQEAQKEQEYEKNSSSDQSELITESHAELNKKNSKSKERVVIKPPVINSKKATVLKGSIYEIVDLEPEKIAEENKEESSPSHLASSKFVQEEISKALIEIKNKTENHDSPNQSQDKLETQEENTVPKLLEQEKPDLERSREENPSEEPKKVALDQESSAQEISSNEKKVEPEGIIQDTSQKPETETNLQEIQEEQEKSEQDSSLSPSGITESSEEKFNSTEYVSEIVNETTYKVAKSIEDQKKEAESGKGDLEIQEQENLSPSEVLEPEATSQETQKKQEESKQDQSLNPNGIITESSIAEETNNKKQIVSPIGTDKVVSDQELTDVTSKFVANLISKASSETKPKKSSTDDKKVITIQPQIIPEEDQKRTEFVTEYVSGIVKNEVQKLVDKAAKNLTEDQKQTESNESDLENQTHTPSPKIISTITPNPTSEKFTQETEKSEEQTVVDHPEIKDEIIKKALEVVLAEETTETDKELIKKVVENKKAANGEMLDGFTMKALDSFEYGEWKRFNKSSDGEWVEGSKIQSPSSSCSPIVAQSLISLYKPQQFGKTDIWKDKERGNDLVVVNGVYDSRLEIENCMKLAILSAAYQAGIKDLDQLNEAISIAKSQGGVSHKLNDDGKTYSGAENDRILKKFSALVQKENEKIGILSSNQKKGLRLTHIPESVIVQFREAKRTDFDLKDKAILDNKATLVDNKKEANIGGRS